MNHLETLIEEYKGELAELEKAYHTFTDVVGNHCDTGAIVKAIQEQIIVLVQKKNDVQMQIDAASYVENEWDRYDNY